jgi:hypothetical protein
MAVFETHASKGVQKVSWVLHKTSYRGVWVSGLITSERYSPRAWAVQGHLAHNKLPPPMTLLKDYA